MTSTWQPVPLVTDPAALQNTILGALVAAVPGYVPLEGSLDTALASIFALETARTNDAVASFADLAAVAIGVSVFGLPVIAGSPATLIATIVSTVGGETLPATFTVTGVSASGDTIALTLGAPLTLTGTSTTATFTASTVGTSGNGIGAGPLLAQTATQTVTTVTATAASSGGITAETPTDYLNRFKAIVATLSPGVVRAEDVTAVARTVPGVQRSLAVNLLDATTNNTNASRTVSVFPVDAAGAPLSADVKTALAAALAASREVNFIFRIADPTYSAVTVAFTAVARAGYATATVQANVVAALTAFLSPATWGGANLDDEGAAIDWTPTPTIRWGALLAAAYGADGVAYVQTLTLNGAQADVTLTGYAALPAAAGGGAGQSAVTGTVTALP